MTWLAVIALAAVVFAIAAFGFGLFRGLWSSLAAALGFGLAGYAMQASPDLPAAPKSAIADSSVQEFDVVGARREFVALSDRSGSPLLITSDAMARRGRYADAAQMLEGVTRQSPNDFEAWLAQGIALAEHAEGNLSQASLYALQKAADLEPDNLAPGYFLGVALVQQGRLIEARQVWRETLANAPEDAEGRVAMTERLTRLEAMLGAMQAGQSPMPPPPENAMPSESGE